MRPGWRMLFFLALGIVPALAPAGDDSAETVRAVMDRLNKGPKALTPLLRRELLATQPPWGLIQEQTKIYRDMTEKLTRMNPPQGDRDSWSRQTKNFAASARALDEAARKSDKEAAIAAQQRLSRACTSCHQVHRPRQ